MVETKVEDCQIIDLPKIFTEKGSISSINNLIEIPFEINRVYYLYDIPGGETRGGHAHKELRQLIIAASGSFEVVLDDGFNKRAVRLSHSYRGLLMPPGLWRELNDFSTGSICLVLASMKYDESDYIRDYEEFLNYKLK